jgi:hypothetical protein
VAQATVMSWLSLTANAVGVIIHRKPIRFWRSPQSSRSWTSERM